MRIWNVRRPLGAAKHGHRWTTDTHANGADRTVWARTRAEAIDIGESIIPGLGQVIARTGRLAINPELYQPPTEPRELQKKDYKGWPTP